MSPCFSSSLSSALCFKDGTLFVELPGVSKSDIILDISEEGGLVTISAEREEPFSKTFDYSHRIDEAKYDISSANASYDNGILSVVFTPLVQKKLNKRNIHIN